MKQAVPRFTRWLRWVAFLGLVLGMARPAWASHLLGGELTYRYLDADGPAAAPYRYELSASVYVTCGSSFTVGYLDIYLYNQATGARLTLAPTNLNGTTTATLFNGGMRVMQASIGACTAIPIPPGCTITGAQQPYQLQKFVGVVCLPASTAGFYALTSASGARNAGITNLGGNASSSYSLTLYSSLAPPVYANHSPVFVDNAVALICANDTTVILNNAVDADGDRLAYSFGQPYSVSPGAAFALNYVPYTNANYSATAPFGNASICASCYAGIDPATGITKYRAALLGGHYGVAVDVKEYRTVNGQEVLLGTTRRDVQLVVGNCPTVAPPVLPPSTQLARNYTIEVGGTLTIPLSATQADNHPLSMTATSALLDGAGGYTATFAGNAGTLTFAGSPVGAYTVAGTTAGSVAGAFVFTPACSDARSTPYDVTVTVNDTGCAGKLTGDVLHITVTKPSGPTAIAGNLAICGLNSVQRYTASGGTSPVVRWTATGGTIVGSNTANPVQVQWPAAGTYTLVAQGLSQYGCPTDQVSSTVVVSPAPALTVAGAQTICHGSSTSLTVTGGTGPYTLTGGAAPLTGAGPFVLSPTQTTTYTITGTASGGACPTMGQVTVAVLPAPVANAGAALALCSGGSGQLGAAATAGYSYSWSPATGLSSPTAANPTVTLTNAGSTALTQTYTLTTTSTASGCASTATVVVMVAPPPVAVPGAALAICAGSSGQLGAPPVAGYSYSWSPATGLSSPTVANPTVTLATATSQTYTLTVTTAAGCSSTGSVAVAVAPAVQPGSIGAGQTVCAGTVPAPLASTAAASSGLGPYDYQWELSPDNVSWQPIANATGPGYAPGAVPATTYFRRRVTTSACGNPMYSNVVTVQTQLPLVPTVALPRPPRQCAGLPFTFVPVPGNAGAAPTYQWFVNNAPVATGPTYTSSTLASGDVVRVVLTPTAGFCAAGTATDTAQIRPAGGPVPALTVRLNTALPTCAGQPISFSLDQTANVGASPQYQWQVDGVAVPGATSTSFASTTLRHGQAITLLVRTTDACGQPVAADVPVRLSRPAQLSAGPDKTIMEGESVVLEGSADGSYPLVWAPAATLTFAAGDTLHPRATPRTTTTYTLAARAGYCADPSTVTVTVLPRIGIPNAFSPNGDNTDDTWQIDNIDLYPSAHVQVFNRWGRKLFDALGYGRANEWNGTCNGEPMPLGTYYYIVTLGNGRSYAGPLTVVR